MLLNDVKQCIKRRMNEHQGNAKDKDTNAEKNILMQKRANLYVSGVPIGSFNLNKLIFTYPT